MKKLTQGMTLASQTTLMLLSLALVGCGQTGTAPATPADVQIQQQKVASFGLVAKWYASNDFTGPLTINTANKPGTGQSGSAAAKSVRWNGLITGQNAESVMLYVSSRHTVRIVLDGNEVMWHTPDTLSVSSVEVMLRGKAAPSTIQIDESGLQKGKSDLKLEWSSPTQTREGIPPHALTPRDLTADCPTNDPIKGCLAKYVVLTTSSFVAIPGTATGGIMVQNLSDYYNLNTIIKSDTFSDLNQQVSIPPSNIFSTITSYECTETNQSGKFGDVTTTRIEDQQAQTTQIQLGCFGSMHP